MAQLIYQALTSLDGYVNDAKGNFDWAEPNEQVHEFVNDLERPIGTYLYGRKLYETMVAWETMHLHDQPRFMREYAEIWRSAEKVIFSSSLADVASRRTRIERDTSTIAALKEHATADLAIGGPTLAAVAIRAGLVDEFRQFISPVIVGGGTPWLPADVFQKLQLVEQRDIGGTVYLRYRVA
ncbi:MAG: dihydrofolate reductase family protein [Rhodoglobus sp.]